jgi:hypothetical protein
VTVQNRGGYAESFNVTVYANSTVVGVQSVSLDVNASAVLHFSWNTSGLGKGDYTISASASIVSGEVYTADNSLVAAEPVTILIQGHDVAVIGVIPSKTIVGQGYSMNITVKVKNYGTFNEVFNVTGYVNATVIFEINLALASGQLAVLTFTWNTADSVTGNYIMGAYGWPVEGEAETSDNNLTSTIQVHVGVPGDVSSDKPGIYDGICNMRDVTYLILLFNTNPKSTNWDPNADVNNDGVCNMRDVTVAILNFNKRE